jgi:hypothetical protein
MAAESRRDRREGSSKAQKHGAATWDKLFKNGTGSCFFCGLFSDMYLVSCLLYPLRTVIRFIWTLFQVGNKLMMGYDVRGALQGTTSSNCNSS